MIIPEDSQKKTAVTNLTALWALSEGFLGGILSALKIPFKGLLLGSVSVIVITLIANNSEKKGIIFRSGVIVMMVKAILSPYSSVTAYLAVFMQTILGELLFLRKKLLSLSSVLLGIITSVLSSVQRIIVLTILFGNAFWDTVDRFAVYAYGEITGVKNTPDDISPSKWIIGIYVGIHAVAGMIVGLYASKLARTTAVSNPMHQKVIENILKNSNEKQTLLPSAKKKKRILKFTGLVIYVFLLIVLILSYTSSDQYFDKNSVWLMIIRSLVITVLWFKVVSPLLGNFVREKLFKSKGKYSEEIKGIMNIFPNMKIIISNCWQNASGSGLGKLTEFISLTLSVVMYSRFDK